MTKKILCITPDPTRTSALVAALQTLGKDGLVLVMDSKKLATPDEILHDAIMELKNTDYSKDFLPIAPEEQTPPNVYGQMLDKKKHKRKK